MDSTFLKKLIDVPGTDINRSYKMGCDCALNGANETNCHFSLFQTKECTAAWELGKHDVEEKGE